MSEIITVQDLETLKKHEIFEAEVITGFAGGVAGGAYLAAATNPVTGQVQATLPEILKDVGFKPGAGDFTTGFTVAPGERDYAWYDPVSVNWYSYLGGIPPMGYIVAPGTNPVGDVNWKPVTDAILRDELARVNVNSVSELSGLTSSDLGKRVQWFGYYAASDGGSNWGIVKSGAHVHDGGSIFSITPTLYVEANLKGGRISILKFGAKADSTSAALATNNGPIVEKIVAYLKAVNGGEIYVPPVGQLDSYYGLSTSNDL